MVALLELVEPIAHLACEIVGDRLHPLRPLIQRKGGDDRRELPGPDLEQRHIRWERVPMNYDSD